MIADFAITQFFFEIDSYLSLVEGLSTRNVEKPVIPGIMPITNLASVARMAQLSGAAIPTWLTDRLEAVADDPEAVRAASVSTPRPSCAPACSMPVRPACTSTHSTARPRLGRSTRTSAWLPDGRPA